MKILSINSGSSSLKFMIFNYNTRETLASGGVERVGLDGSVLEFSCKRHAKVTVQHDCPDHTEAVRLALESMVNPEYGILESMDEIKAVGHRVLHGGDKIKQSVIVDDHTIELFKSLFDLGPLHMPPNIMGIEAARKVLPNVPHMAIMDTAWHQSMPDYAFMYALPYEWYEKYGIRRYGFHGTSHLYVSKRTAVLLGKEPKDTNAIILHIGNGASACAIKNGRCVDTSMGLTPLEGLIMGTRAGDFDCAINYFMMNKEGLAPDQMNDIANKKSGHLGITGKYSDRRDIEKGMREGDDRCRLAIEMEAYRLKKYIGSYFAAIGGADAVVFTAGVGEFSPVIRAKALEGLECLGIKLDPEKNNVCCCRNSEFEISADDSKVKVLVVPTDEEIVFIEDVVALLQGRYKDPSEYVYDFQKSDYVNRQRAMAFEEDLKKNPALAKVSLHCKDRA